jgi:hypothetical protein
MKSEVRNSHRRALDEGDGAERTPVAPVWNEAECVAFFDAVADKWFKLHRPRLRDAMNETGEAIAGGPCPRVPEDRVAATWDADSVALDLLGAAAALLYRAGTGERVPLESVRLMIHRALAALEGYEAAHGDRQEGKSC